MYYAGIDIGGMSIKVGIVNENGEILINRAIATDSSSGFSVMVSNMATLIKELLLELSIKENDLSGIGIGIPGVADSKKVSLRPRSISVGVTSTWSKNSTNISKCQ